MTEPALTLCDHPPPSRHESVHGCCREKGHDGPHYVWMLKKVEDEWSATVWEDTGELLNPRVEMELAEPVGPEEMCVTMAILDANSH